MLCEVYIKCFGETAMKITKWFVLFTFFICSNVFALTELNSRVGGEMLTFSLLHHYADPFLSEVRYFTNQENTSFCGIASAAIVLNTLQIKPPKDADFGDYQLFTQDNIFTADAVKKLNIKQSDVLAQGMTLEKETQLLNAFPSVKAHMYSTKNLSLAETKAILLKALKSNKQLVIVNIFRPEMEEMGGGHFSPLVAYDPKSDHVLFMDVASYKYGPTWVPIETLYQAMHTKDGDAYRGFIVVTHE